jgi:hypothetical protein
MNKKTSQKVASQAGKIMSDNSSSAIQRKLAGTVLSQVGNNKTTSENMESVASKVLKSNKYSAETKELAASALSQSTKKVWEK